VGRLSYLIAVCCILHIIGRNVCTSSFTHLQEVLEGIDVIILMFSIAMKDHLGYQKAMKTIMVSSVFLNDKSRF
jgi:hypothetical protein